MWARENVPESQISLRAEFVPSWLRFCSTILYRLYRVALKNKFEDGMNFEIQCRIEKSIHLLKFGESRTPLWEISLLIFIAILMKNN